MHHLFLTIELPARTTSRINTHYLPDQCVRETQMCVGGGEGGPRLSLGSLVAWFSMLFPIKVQRGRVSFTDPPTLTCIITTVLVAHVLPTKQQNIFLGCTICGWLNIPNLSASQKPQKTRHFRYCVISPSTSDFHNKTLSSAQTKQFLDILT